MSQDRVKLKVVEIDATELKPDAKYLFILNPNQFHIEEMEGISAALRDFLGENRVMCLFAEPGSVTPYAIPNVKEELRITGVKA